ncbi:MAG TPA: hypothetical protein PK954_16800, partial [Anaerolineales bacterium]|nr:hypothetical protein [Anaerolineales bacterium]
MQPTQSAGPSWAGRLVLIAGLAVAFTAYYLASLLRWFGVALPNEGPAMSILWKTIAAAIIIGFIYLIERRSLASVNLVRPSEKEVTWAFYLWGASMTWYWVVSLLVPPAQSDGVDTIAGLHPLVVLG